MPDNENTKGPQSKGVSRRQFLTRTAAGTAGAIALTTVLDACGGSSSSTPATSTTDAQALTTAAWKFGVIADTQWTLKDDGFSPNTSAVGIAAQIQQQLIAQGVKFAVHVGDLCDIDQLATSTAGTNIGTNGTIAAFNASSNNNDSNATAATNLNAGEYTRALYSQSLYNAGIGFFPLRGNHDEDMAGAKAFLQCYPQTSNNGKHTSPSATVASYLSSLGLSGPSADNYLKADAPNNPLLADTGSDFTIGSNFSSPSATQCPFAVVNGVNGLTGLTYSFDFNGARFILLDQFSPSNGAWYYSAMEGAIGGTSNATSMINGYTGSGYATNIASYAAFFGNPANGPAGQQPWINQQLSGRTGQHTFVFAHKGLLTGNHQDTLFTASSSGATGQTNSANPSYNAAAQNNFFSSLCNNGVRMYINGHDHMHDRSIVTSPDGKSTVMQLTCASDSSKFYGPQGAGTNCASVSAYTAVTPATTPPTYTAAPVSIIPQSSPSTQYSNDIYWNTNNPVTGNNSAIQPPTGQRRQALSQELYTIGYYIFTINGSLVNVDYYSADVPAYPNGASDPEEFVVTTAEGLNFVKRETWGYSLTGKTFNIAAGGSYTVVQDSSSAGTTADILSGTNGCTTTDACYQPYIKLVTTGWMSGQSVPGALSDVVSLWGINPCGEAAGQNPDTYVLAMGVGSLLSGNAAICSVDSNGKLSNAVNQNTGGAKNFVSGPWSSSYGLGTYGVDPTTKTAWAVLNYSGMFAIATAS